MDQNQLDDIIIQTAENATARSLDTIIATLRNAKGGVSPETAEKLEVIWSAWNEEDVELEPEQCAFVIEMAALGFASSAAFRSIRSRVPWGTAPRPLNALETVFLDSPQASAMSCMVTRLVGMVRSLSLFC